MTTAITARKEPAAMTSVYSLLEIPAAQTGQVPLSASVSTCRAKRVAILGSTGSIGKSTLDVIAAANGTLAAVALSAHASLDELAEQANRVRPRWLIATDAEAAGRHVWPRLPDDVELLVGCEGLVRAVTSAEVDVVVSAIVGSAGLRGTWAALEAGKTVALANKETLVTAGPLVTELARRRGTAILPVDSEHSAVFQALQTGKKGELRRIVLTASGGPFRNHTPRQLANVTVDDALAHPTWRMGPKITVDSATLMNKALEIIEARWLFDLSVEQIAVVIHPQSIVHSMVEWVDGSVIAQLSPPDMKLPIQYALTYPERQPGVAARFDWSRSCRLDFEPADEERYPALGLGMEAARRGGTTGAVLNAANEAAVAGFLQGKLKFNQIVPLVKSVLEHHHFDPSPSLERVMRLDGWAREEVVRCIGN